MKEILVEGANLPAAYHKALVALEYYGEEVECPDYNCKQKECSLTMVVNEPLAEPRISKLCLCYPEALEQYRQELLDGILDFKVGDGWEYTYHDRIANYKIVHDVGVDQVKFIVDELTRNPQSRRAVIDIRLNKDDMYSDDPACLQHIQYFIRNNKLDCKVLFRSNDATRATFMNAFGLIELQHRIADKLGIEVGEYVHRANSFHCYESEFYNLQSYANAIEDNPIENLVYYYKDDWEDEMNLSKEAINKKVEELKCQRK